VRPRLATSSGNLGNLGKQALLRPCAPRDGFRFFFHGREGPHQAQRFGVMSENLKQLVALGTIPANCARPVN
jgi:hypothetical protein